jgi:hypothetical protein
VNKGSALCDTLLVLAHYCLHGRGSETWGRGLGASMLVRCKLAAKPSRMTVMTEAQSYFPPRVEQACLLLLPGPQHAGPCADYMT